MTNDKKIEVIKDHTQQITGILEDLNNHQDVIFQHGGEIEIWQNHISRKWAIKSANLILKVESEK